MPHPTPGPAGERAPGAAVETTARAPADWIRDHLDAVYRYTRRLLPAADAEDVAQQAFEALFRAHAAGRGPDDPGAYLFGVARRRAADVLRRRARRPAAVPLPAGWDTLGETALPDEACEADELRELVHVAMGLLGSAAASLLNARYRRGAALDEIAESLGVSRKAVEMRLRRARAAFLEHFRRVGRDWTDEARDLRDERPDGSGEGTR